MLASVGGELLQALSFAFGMFWEILWALILGFALSGVVQAVVSKREMRRLLPDDSPRTLAIAAGLGAASRSLSVYRSECRFLASLLLLLHCCPHRDRSRGDAHRHLQGRRLRWQGMRPRGTDWRRR